MYKLLALDMDGTLLNDDKTISLNNKTAVREVIEKGINVILSTGRSLDGIKNYLEDMDLLNENSYAVTFNGCCVQNVATGKCLYKKSLNYDDIISLYELSQLFDVNFQFSTPDCLITNKMNSISRLSSKNNNIPVYEKSIYELPKSTQIIRAAFIEEKDKLDSITNSIPQDYHERYNIARSGDNYLEFLPTDANKWVGVKLIADNLNISSKEIVSIGDAYNDIEMIKNSGFGVAMENGYAEVKKNADYITKTNEENGVAYAISKIFLE